MIQVRNVPENIYNALVEQARDPSAGVWRSRPFWRLRGA